MNELNPLAPDPSQGQGTGSPANANASGQGNPPPAAGSGQGSGNNNNSNNGGNANYETMIQEAQRKITEMGQTNSTLSKKLEGFESKHTKTNEVLSNMLRELTGQTANNDPQKDFLDQIIDNPNALAEHVTKLIEEKTAPFVSRIESREATEFISNQESEMLRIKGELSKNFSPKMIDKLIDVSHMINPDIVKSWNRLKNDPTLSDNDKAILGAKVQLEFAGFLRQAGGYQNLVKTNLGHLMMGNLNDVLRDAAIIENSRISELNRFPGGNYNNGGAPTQSKNGYSGSSNYSVTSEFG